jgi:hypothetical protein
MKEKVIIINLPLGLFQMNASQKEVALMRLQVSDKKQFFNSLKNQQRELENIQSKIVNLRLLEKNLIKSIKKKQQNFKLSLKESEESTGKTIQGLLLPSKEEIFREESLRLHEEFLIEPTLLNLDEHE